MTTIPVGALVRDRELPELGPGRIMAEMKGGASRIVFEHQDEMRDVDLKRVDVVRLPLIPGTKVQIKSGRYGDEEVEHGEVLDAELPDTPAELCDYIVRVDGDKRTVSEAEVFPAEPDSTHPVDQFDALFWRGPFRFFARWGTHQTVSQLYEDAEGLPALIGARIDPKPHLVRAARRALWAPEPRFVLADASQQDRMLEAGMIAQCLQADDPQMRTLIVAPGMRTREWVEQMNLRFGGRDWDRITESTVAGMEFFEMAQLFQGDRIVITDDVIGRSDDVQTLLAGEEFGLVIFAGAHRLKPGSDGYNFAREISRMAGASIALSPMPRSADPQDLAGLFGLIRPDEYDPTQTEEVERYVEENRAVWQALSTSLEAAADGQLEADELDALADTWAEAEEEDPVFDEKIEAMRDGEVGSVEELMAYVQSFYGFADLAVRTPHAALEEHGVTWPERVGEVVEYDAHDKEVELMEHLAELPMPDEPSDDQKILRMLYARRACETPERFLDLLHDRGDAIQKAPEGVGGLDLMSRISSCPDPTEGNAIWERSVEQAAAMPEEEAWIGKALGIVQGWDNAEGRKPARYQEALGWIDNHLEEAEVDEEEGLIEVRKVVVYSRSRRQAEAFHSAALSVLGDEGAVLYHAELPDSMKDDAIERFQHDDECPVLVVDELGAEGHRLDDATGIVHLDHPLSPEAVDVRIGRVERAGGEEPIPSAILQGPGAFEGKLVELYHDVLDLYEAQPGPVAGEYPELEHALIEMVGADGPEALDGLLDDWRDRLDEAMEPEVRAYQASIDPRPDQLEDVVGFADLLDFADGIDDALSVRHWARMIGIDDHRVRPGVYDFKWHWSSVRRDLPGFDIPEGDDPNEWADEDTVRYLSGTFSREHALDEEDLEFFGPGHLFIDSIFEDAMGPTDGRATVFARRLNGRYRGKMFAVIVAQLDLNEEVWGELEPPEGLIRQAHRRFWPECSTAMVEIDPKGNREPSIVDDTDLEQRLQESYEGPDADQKIEYETLVRAIEDAGEFRQTLRDAIDAGLENMRDERDWLVEDAVNRLEEDFRSDIDYWKGVEARADSDDERREAERQVELRERLIASAEDYAIDVDAIALVVGGTPEALLH